MQQHKEQMAQQREREQNLAAAIAMVVQNARNVDLYGPISPGINLCQRHFSYQAL